MGSGERYGCGRDLYYKGRKGKVRKMEKSREREGKGS
jgi:hypothetical protein